MVRKFNVLEHELVPLHEVLEVREALNILRQLRVKPEKLPWIRENDPAARSIGAKPGDIVRITRKSHTARRAVSYRYVVTG